jgi:NAD+ kinase
MCPDDRLNSAMKRIGILYHPKTEKAIAFSKKLEEFLSARDFSTWRCSAWEPEDAKRYINGTDLLLSIGGDGTILRAARTIYPDSVPILGINLGKLGFMAELKAAEALDKLPDLLSGKGWIEERALLEATLTSHGKTFHGLNDAFVGRRSMARLVNIQCKLNGALLTTYRADGVLVSTATGSTGYALAAGGPILHPQSKEMILQPVCAHFSLDKALVLPSKARVELTVTTTHEAMLSIDGQTEIQLNSGDKVIIKQSSYTAKFLRAQSRSHFYKHLEAKLKRKVS